MNTLDFGRIRLQAGLCFEGTNENVLGYQVLFDADGNLCAGPTDPGCPPNFTSAVIPVRRTPSYRDACRVSGCRMTPPFVRVMDEGFPAELR